MKPLKSRGRGSGALVISGAGCVTCRDDAVGELENLGDVSAGVCSCGRSLKTLGRFFVPYPDQATAFR
jgi:hypothetical protein